MGGGVQENACCKNIRQGVLMLAGFSICHTSMWIFTQKTDASIKYVTHAVITDPATYYMRIPNAVALGLIYHDNGLDDLFIDLYNKTYAVQQRHLKPTYNYGISLIRTNKQEEGYDILEQMIQKRPYYPLPYPPLIEHYIEIRDYDALYRVCVQMESEYQQNPGQFLRLILKEQIDWYLDILAKLRRKQAAGQ